MNGPRLSRLMRRVMACFDGERVDQADQIYVLRCILTGLLARIELDSPGSADLLAERMREEVTHMAGMLRQRLGG